jgi:putative transposase
MDAIFTEKAQQLASEIAAQAKSLDDVNGLIKLMMKSALERMLNTEMDVHLGRTNSPLGGAPNAMAIPAEMLPEKRLTRNRRNGRSKKTMQGDLGKITLETPRDREGTFEPQVIPKHQRRLDGFNEKILALYAKGMTTRDIQDIVQELYGVDVSPTLISEITADLDTEATAWRTRQLDPVWPIVYLDGARARRQWSCFAQNDVRGLRCEYAGPQGTFGTLARRSRGRQVLVVMSD